MPDLVSPASLHQRPAGEQYVRLTADAMNDSLDIFEMTAQVRERLSRLGPARPRLRTYSQLADGDQVQGLAAQSGPDRGKRHLSPIRLPTIGEYPLQARV